MPFVIADAGSIIYYEQTEQIAMYISRKAANTALATLLPQVPNAEIIEVQVEKKQ